MVPPTQPPLTGAADAALFSKDASLDIPALPAHPAVHADQAPSEEFTPSNAEGVSEVLIASPEDATKYEQLGRDPERVTRSRLSFVASLIAGSVFGGGAVYLLLFAPSAPLSLLGGLFLLGVSAVILSPLLKQASTGELEEMLTEAPLDQEEEGVSLNSPPFAASDDSKASTPPLS